MSMSNKFKFRSGEIVVAKKGEFIGMKLKIERIEGLYARVKPIEKGLEEETWDVRINNITKHFKP